jgi:hypothetical protein
MFATARRSDAPLGIKAIALFFAFGTGMSALTALLLCFPGSSLDLVWNLNPEAHDGFRLIGGPAVLLMAVVAASCAAAGIGLWRIRGWGYWIAVAVLSINVIGDILNFVVRHDWRTLIGLPVGGAMILFLYRRRKLFHAANAAP